MAASCSSASADHEAHSIENKPHQPKKFSFPKREFGIATVVRQSFQPSWFDKWPWLHYCENSNSVFCFTCMQANSENKLHWSLNAFITSDFANWKKVFERFNNHETSKCHKEAVLCMITPLPHRILVNACPKSINVKNLSADSVFLKILLNIRFLAKQGLPL